MELFDYIIFKSEPNANEDTYFIFNRLGKNIYDIYDMGIEGVYNIAFPVPGQEEWTFPANGDKSYIVIRDNKTGIRGEIIPFLKMHDKAQELLIKDITIDNIINNL